jgi:hypothetical protein
MICGTGWGTWAQRRAALADWTAVWSDVTGAHLAAPPAEAPVGATHLWAWSGDLWARVRIDEGDAVIGYLHPEGQCPRGAVDCPDAQLSRPVLARSWAEAHVDVGELRDVTWRVVDVVDGVAATFVRAAH